MIHRRNILASASLAASAAFVFLLSATPVQAHMRFVSPALEKGAPSGNSLPREYDLHLYQAAASGTQDGQLPEGKGRELVQKKCNMCHASTVWTKKHYTEDQWTSVMDQMVEKGMTASDEEIATMTSYLVANFGPAKKESPPPALPSR